MATDISVLLPGTHQMILETIIQCEQCNSSGELKIEEPTLEFLDAMKSRLQ
jgi:hypothetical protein